MYSLVVIILISCHVITSGQDERFEFGVLTVTTMKNAVIWVVRPGSPNYTALQTRRPYSSESKMLKCQRYA
jgi:hypothetical protein